MTRPWSKFDLRWMAKARKDGLAVKEIADELKRTPGEIMREFSRQDRLRARKERRQ